MIDERRPVILVADDDPAALDLLESSLTRRFGADYQIVIESNPRAALRRLEQLHEAGAQVALILADQSMPQMTGVELLAAAAEIYPGANREVLVRWGEIEGEREPILRAAALGQIESFIAKPWREGDEAFYHAVSHFLEEWDHSHRPQLEVIRIVGDPLDAYCQGLRDALARSGVPTGFYDVATDDGRRLLEAAGVDGPLPVAIMFNGQALARPTPSQIATALGVNADYSSRVFDLVIIGSGPAGLSAAVYGASEGLDVLLVEGEALGGQASSSTMIKNYLGFPRGLTGADLTARAYRQAWFFGTWFVIGRSAAGLGAGDGLRVVTFDDGSEVRSRALILATGVSWRRLGVERLEELVGQGVFYGAPLTEAPGTAGQHVFVVGGGNSSAQAVLHLARYAQQVTLVVRDPILGEMSDYLIREIEAARNIDVRLNAVVVDAEGEARLQALVLMDVATGQRERVETGAVFVLIGGEPRTDWLPPEVLREERGYILTGDAVGQRPDGSLPQTLETSMAGVFAVGDVRNGSMKRIAAAVGEGSTAIRKVHEYLRGLQQPPDVPDLVAAATDDARPGSS